MSALSALSDQSALLFKQFWLTLLAVLVILAIQLFAIQQLSHLPSFVSLLVDISVILQFDLKVEKESCGRNHYRIISSDISDRNVH